MLRHMNTFTDHKVDVCLRLQESDKKLVAKDKAVKYTCERVYGSSVDYALSILAHADFLEFQIAVIQKLLRILTSYSYGIHLIPNTLGVGSSSTNSVLVLLCTYGFRAKSVEIVLCRNVLLRLNQTYFGHIN